MIVNDNNTGSINTALLDIQRRMKNISGSQSDYLTSNDTSLLELKTQTDSLIIPVGSQVLYDSWSTTVTDTGRGTVLGLYGNYLIGGIFNNLTTPEGYHKVWRLTLQASTANGTMVGCSLNSFIYTDQANTWSGSSFRKIVGSSWFSEDDIVLEPTMSYIATAGINLYMDYTLVGGSAAARIYNVTIHGAYLKD